MLVVNSDLVSDSPHQIQTSNFKKKKRFRPRSHKAQALYTHLLAAPIQERIGSSGWMYGGEPADGGGDGTDDASTGSWLSSAGVSLLLASSCFWSSSLSSDLHIHIWQGKQNITSTIYIYSAPPSVLSTSTWQGNLNSTSKFLLRDCTSIINVLEAVEIKVIQLHHIYVSIKKNPILRICMLSRWVVPVKKKVPRGTRISRYQIASDHWI